MVPVCNSTVETMACMQELIAQVVALTDQVQTLSSRLLIAEQNTALQTQTGSRRGDSGVFDKQTRVPQRTYGHDLLSLLVQEVQCPNDNGQ